MLNVFRGSRARFAVPLGMGGKRDMDTLEPLIIAHIKPGTTIMTDGWSSYNSIESLTDSNGQLLNYKHEVVNHNENFVNPENEEVHTQKVERFWGDLKDRVIKRRVKNFEQLVHRYLFLFKHFQQPFHNLMVESGKAFPFSRFIVEP